MPKFANATVGERKAGTNKECGKEQKKGVRGAYHDDGWEKGEGPKQSSADKPAQ